MTRVSEVTQKDGRNRLDVYIANRLDMGQEVADLLKEGLPDSWYVREQPHSSPARIGSLDGAKGKLVSAGAARNEVYS